jgi:hypothetical protein
MRREYSYKEICELSVQKVCKAPITWKFSTYLNYYSSTCPIPPFYKQRKHREQGVEF